MPEGGVLGALPLTSGLLYRQMPCLLIQMLTHLPRPPSAFGFPLGKLPFTFHIRSYTGNYRNHLHHIHHHNHPDHLQYFLQVFLDNPGTLSVRSEH